MSGVKPGMVYRGSLEEAHGAVVEKSRPCHCPRCDWRAFYHGERRRLEVEVMMPDGFPETLSCAGEGSFVEPDV